MRYIRKQRRQDNTKRRERGMKRDTSGKGMLRNREGNTKEEEGKRGTYSLFMFSWPWFESGSICNGGMLVLCIHLTVTIIYGYKF